MPTYSSLMRDDVSGGLVGTSGQVGMLHTNRYWNGERDYSFLVTDVTGKYHISTPAQYAALCFVTSGQWRTDAMCPDYVTASKNFSGETVYLDNDIIFNEGYENNKSWIELNYNSGHVNPPENDCTWLRLVNFAGTLDGQLHSIIGLYYHQANESAAPYGSGVFWNTITGTATIRDLYIEHCSLKNYKQGQFCCFYGEPGMKLYNVQVRDSRLVGVTKTSGGNGSVQFGIIAATWSISNIDMRGCGIVNTDAMLYDSSGFASWRSNGLHLAGWDGSVQIYNAFNVNVTTTSSSSQYEFEKTGTLTNCISYNVSGPGRQGTKVTSIEALVTAHNSYSDGISRQLDENLRYI